MTDLKKNNVNDPFSNMNEEKLRTLPVIGVGGLRKFVVKNNIFKGISNLKKGELINDILVSKWWRDNITNKTSKKSDDISKKSDDKSDDESKKKNKAKDVADLAKSLKLRQELQRDLRICEDRIKKRDKSIIERDDEIEALNLLIKKRVDKKDKKSVKKVKKSDKEVDKLVDELKDDEDLRPNNLQVSDIQDIMGDSKPPSPPPAPPIPPPIAPPPKEPIPTDSSTQTPPPHTEGLITHQEPQKQNVDAGHTIVNVYCGGNHHPDYPVPQSVVRQALNANKAPLYQQQDIGNFLRDEARNFNKPAKKFEPVKTITPNKPIDFEKTKRKPERTTQTEDEPLKKSSFEDDDEEEEDEVDRLRRLKREEVARETGKSKGRGFSDAFKRRLEEKLGVKRT